MTALLAMAVGADTPNGVKLIGAFISFAGVALVIAAGQGLVLGASLVGDVLTLVAAACWAVYTVFGATILRRHSPLVTTTWAIIAGAVFLAPARHRPARDRGPVRRSACRSCSRSSTRARWPPGSPTSSSSTA